MTEANARSAERTQPEQSVRPIVVVRGISKRFGALIANHQVSFEVGEGRILGLVGENGAGKTTLMNVLAGIYLPEKGEILIDGEPLPLGSPRASVESGIGMVHQSFKLVETLTGFENISLGLHRKAVWQPVSLPEAVEDLQETLGFSLDLRAPVWQLSLAERQQLEILRTLALGCRLLILDEPTSVLSPIEAEKLFAILRRIADSGRAVVLISHKLDEVLSVADDLVVMRAGRVVHTGRAAEAEIGRLAKLIVGDREIIPGRRPRAPLGETILRVMGLTVHNDLGLPAVHEVDLEVRAGELVVIVGVAGNGQTELLDAIAGMRRPSAGTVWSSVSTRPRLFAYVPERHLGMGLAPGLPLIDNAILGHHRRPPFGWWIRVRQQVRLAEEVTARFGVQTPLRAPVRRLSGGNLQRAMVGRELHGEPELIVACYPTRGLDVASAAQIREELVRRAEQGAAVLVASEELVESLEMAGRVLVLHRGRLVAELDPDEADPSVIGRLMTTGEAT